MSNPQPSRNEQGDAKNNRQDPSSAIELLNKIKKLDLNFYDREKIAKIASNTAGSSMVFNHDIIGDTGAAAVGQALGQNQTLTSLCLQGNRITDIGAAALGHGLRQNQALEVLNARRNKFTRPGLLVLAKGFLLSSSMKTLDAEVDLETVAKLCLEAIQETLYMGPDLADIVMEFLSIKNTYPTTRRITQRMDGEFGSVSLASIGNNSVVKKIIREMTYERLLLQGLPRHECVVRLVAYSSNIGDRSLLLEAHKGGTLRDYASKNKDGVQLVQFLEYSHNMCDAIVHLHKHGVVYRDIDLRNYVLTVDLKMAILVNFGLCRQIEGEKSVELRPGEKMPYRKCAPEVLSTCQYFKASDVWQLGLAMWQCLFGGKQPFMMFTNGQQVLQYLIKQMQQCKKSVPLSFRKRGAPQILISTIKELVVFCCQFDPAERPSATQLVGKIESLRDSMDAPAVDVRAAGEGKYEPEACVAARMEAYNYTRWPDEYIDLYNDLECHKNEQFETFPDVDVLSEEENSERQYGVNSGYLL